MDPFTTLGIASNVVQLVELAKKVAQRLNEFRDRTGETPKAFRGVGLRLPLLIDGLTRTNAAIKSESSDVNTETYKVLSHLVNSCLAQTTILNDILNQTLPQRDDSWAKRNKKAFQSLTKDRSVQRIELELNNCIGLLTFHHVTPVVSSTSQYSASSASLSPAEIDGHLYEVPRRRVSKFIGRETILADIEEKFERSSIVILQGMGGQGKTQLAIEYCQRSRGKTRYAAIFWADASSEIALKRSFENISEVLTNYSGNLGSFDAKIAYTKTTLSSWSSPWLLVFDNYDDPFLFPNVLDFIPSSNYGRILFTTRHADVSHYGACIHISRLLESEAVELLFSRTMLERTSLNTKHCIDISKRLGSHPLALEQAAAYIRKRSGSLPLSQFLDHYQRRKKDILQLTPKAWEYRKQLGDAEAETSLSLFTTLELSYEQLGRDKGTTARLQEIFSLFAFFYHGDIEENLFRIYQKRTQSIMPVASWIEIFLNDGEWNRDNFEDAIIELHDLALIEAHYKGSDASVHISIHPLVKDWMRLRADEETCRQQSLLATSILREYLADSFHGGIFWISPNETQTSLLHLTAIEENYKDFFTTPSNYHLVREEIVQLREAYVLFAKFLLYFDRHTEAHNLLERILDIWSGDVGPEDATLLDIIRTKGVALRNEGKFNQAEAIFNQVIHTQRITLGDNHVETLKTQEALAELHHDKGEFSVAEVIYRSNAGILERTLGAENPSRLRNLNNLALALRDQSKNKEAETIFSQLLSIQYRISGSDHPHTLLNLHNLAIVFADLGKFKESESTNRQVLEKRREILGFKHPRTLQSASNLGFVLCELGRYSDAEDLGRETLSAVETVVGKDHLDTMHTVNNLAMVYLEQGRLDEAKDTVQRALDVRETLLGKEHPHTLHSLHTLSLVLHAQGRLKDAETILRCVSELRARLLGAQNPRTLSSGAALGRVIRDQGHRTQAKELLFSMLQAHRDVLGQLHPHTLTVAVDYALVLDSPSSRQEAMSLIQESYTGMVEAFDSEHPLLQRLKVILANGINKAEGG